MSVISVRNANNQAVDVELPPPPGRAAAAASRPVALSVEDEAILTSMLAAFVTATPAGGNVIGKVDHTTSGISSGSKVVAAAGTAVVLLASTPAKWVTVQANKTNSSIVAVGGAGVLAASSGIALSAGESITLPIDNLADVYVDAVNSGEGVRFVYGT